MRAIPLALRERMVQLYEAGRSTRDLAGMLGCCVAAVRRVSQQFKERGTRRPRTPLAGRQARLEALVTARPDATLAELGRGLDRPFRTSTVDGWLGRLGWRHKKNAARRRAGPPRRGRPKGGRA